MRKLVLEETENVTNFSSLIHAKQTHKQNQLHIFCNWVAEITRNYEFVLLKTARLPFVLYGDHWRKIMQRTGRKLYTYGNLGEAETEIWSDREIVYCK